MTACILPILQNISNPAFTAKLQNKIDNKSKPLADQITVLSLFIAFLWLFVVIAFVFIAYDAIDLVVPLLTASIAFLYMWRLFAQRLQGFTGDCLGATQQVCKVAFYLGLALSLA